MKYYQVTVSYQKTMSKLPNPMVNENTKYYQAKVPIDKNRIERLFYDKRFIGQPEVQSVVNVETKEISADMYNKLSLTEILFDQL